MGELNRMSKAARDHTVHRRYIYRSITSIMEAPPSYETSQNNAGAGNYGVGSGGFAPPPKPGDNYSGFTYNQGFNPGAASAPVMVPPPTNQVPVMRANMFGRDPVHTPCPHCGANVTTAVTTE